MHCLVPLNQPADSKFPGETPIHSKVSSEDFFILISIFPTTYYSYLLVLFAVDIICIESFEDLMYTLIRGMEFCIRRLVTPVQFLWIYLQMLIS